MKRFILTALITFALIGCKHSSHTSESDIITEFKKDNPTATVLNAVIGEGDFEHAYWYISFTNSGSSKVQTVEWGARSVDGNSWEIFQK
jgi:hypothetical protein